MSYARKAVKGTIIVFTISLLAAFLGYLIRIVLARNLTTKEYGLFFAVFTLINLGGSIRKFGLSQALVKYIPEFQVKKKLEQIKNAIVTVLGFYVISVLLLASLLILFSNFLAVHYFKDPAATTLLLCFVLIFILGPFKQILRTIFNAFQNVFLFSLMYLVENLLIFLFSILFFIFKLKLYAPVFAYILAYILSFTLFFPFLLKSFPFFKYKFKFSKNLTKKLFYFGVPTMLSGIGGIIILYTDTLILTYFGTLEEVGIYNVVVPTAMLLNFFGNSITQVIFPMISELWSKNLRKQIALGVRLLQKYSFVLVLPAALALFSYPSLLITLFFGTKYVAGATTLRLLSIGMVFFLVAGINMTVLSGIGRPKTTTKIMLAGALFNLVTNFYFIPKYGMLGAGITSLASYLIILILSVYYLRKFIKLQIPWQNWGKIGFASMVFILIIHILSNIFSFDIYIEAIAFTSIAGAIYIGLLILFKTVQISEVKKVLFKQINP